LFQSTFLTGTYNILFNFYLKINLVLMSKMLLICCSCLFLLACQPNKKTSDQCPLGEPTPIYSLDLPFVKSHSFNKTGQNSKEEIIFQDSLYLTIRQSGCEQIRQDYIFSLEPSPAANDQFWIQRSIELFGRLASYSENFYSFNQWADKINESKSEFRLTEPFEVAPQTFVKIDRIPSPEETKLIVSLLQT